MADSAGIALPEFEFSTAEKSKVMEDSMMWLQNKQTTPSDLNPSDVESLAALSGSFSTETKTG
jgi:hypothetical protein